MKMQFKPWFSTWKSILLKLPVLASIALSFAIFFKNGFYLQSLFYSQIRLDSLGVYEAAFEGEQVFFPSFRTWLLSSSIWLFLLLGSLVATAGLRGETFREKTIAVAIAAAIGMSGLDFILDVESDEFLVSMAENIIANIFAGVIFSIFINTALVVPSRMIT